MSKSAGFLLSAPSDVSGRRVCSGKMGLSHTAIRLLVGAVVAAAFFLLAAQRESRAQDGFDATESAAILKLGDVAVSGFAGVKLQTNQLAPGIDPQSKTVIDPEGVTLRVYDGRLVASPFTGQQLDLPKRKDFKAKDIGHVFALVNDNLPAQPRL